MKLSFRETLRRYVPPWLSDRPQTGKTVGFRFLYCLVAPLDAGVQAAIEGVQARYPGIGTPTALLSNSWGDALAYDPRLLEELFDAWVISSEVGLRKPDPAVYELAAERLGVPPHACVFVDDLPGNLKPARALGMATVLHRGDAGATLAEIREHLG